MAIKEILGEHVLAQLTNEELDVQRLASSANMQDDQIDRELRSLQAEVERFDDADKPTAKFQASVAALLDDFRAHALRLDTLCSFLSDKSAQKATDVQAAAKERAKVLDETFNKAMEATLKEQKPLEENVRSLFSFFMEAGCDGEANSVYVTNHHAVSDSYAESLGEASIRDLPLDSNTKQHPVFGMSVDEDGKTKPITIRRLNDVSVVQRMTAAIATSSDITKRSDIIFWAKNSHESNAVWFTNVSRSHVGNAPPDFTTFATTLKEIYGGVDEFHKSMVAVGNRPVVRKKSRFEADHITSHPAFALLGKHYYMQKVANRTMVQSPINPVKDALSKEWICDADGEPILECPWLRDNRSRLAESRMVFIDVISGRLADNEVLHFSSASSTWTEGSPLYAKAWRSFFAKNNYSPSANEQRGASFK